MICRIALEERSGVWVSRDVCADFAIVRCAIVWLSGPCLCRIPLSGILALHGSLTKDVPDLVHLER